MGCIFSPVLEQELESNKVNEIRRIGRGLHLVLGMAPPQKNIKGQLLTGNDFHNFTVESYALVASTNPFLEKTVFEISAL